MRRGLLSMMLFNCRDLKNNKTKSRTKREIRYFYTWVTSEKIPKKAILQNKEAVLQQWAEVLIAGGKTPSTVHTYLASACRGLGVSMRTLDLPRRSIDTKVKSLGLCERAEKEKNSLKNAKLVEFSSRVGLRRSEIKGLQGNNLKREEDYLYVEVLHGKGGKYQKQLIAPDDQEYISSYFDGTPTPIFSPDDMRNKIDLHGIRAEHARQEYARYLVLCNDPWPREN